MTCVLCNRTFNGAHDEICPGCRSKKNARYPWTPTMDEQLTRVYRAAINKTDLSAAITIFARTMRRPRYIVQNRAQFLGLRIREQRLWTSEEIEILHEFGGAKSVSAIAARLGRTYHAVKHKMFTLRISGQLTEGFSQNELATFLGVHHNKIARWIDRGWLTLSGDRITHASAEQFVWDHMDQYRFVACEEWWIKMMLRSGREKLRKRGPQAMLNLAVRRSA